MTTGKKILIALLIVLALAGIFAYKLFVGARNQMVEMEEGVKTKWSQVENVYQRRADLIPNLVETVKGYAKHENSTLTEVTEARAKLGGVVNINSDVVNNPEQMQKFQQMQRGLSGALQRLMVVSENYPDLKANQNFQDLQVQLEGTENRISVERRNYNETVQQYNTFIRKFPMNITASMFGFKRAELFQMEEAAKAAPKVKF